MEEALCTSLALQYFAVLAFDPGVSPCSCLRLVLSLIHRNTTIQSNNNKNTTAVSNWVLPPPLLNIEAIFTDYKIIGKYAKYKFNLNSLHFI